MDLGTLKRERRNELWLLVFRLARAATGSSERAEDLTQKTFLRLGTTRPWAPGETTLAICDLMADDTTKPAHMAKVLGCTAHEIREALKRIRRYVKTIVAAERGEDVEVT